MGIPPVGKSLPELLIVSGSIDRFKEIDGRGVQNPSLRHRFLEVHRCSELLRLLRVLSIEYDNNLALVAVGGMVDPWIDKARRSLRFDMRIKHGTPLAIVLHFV